jgi:Uma2 family endonuclease
MMLAKTKTKIGPQHHGRKMSLKAFEFLETEDGYSVEVARGYIVVGEVANYFHGMQIDVIMDHLRAYKISKRGAIHAIFEGMSCKLLIPAWESERHPDIAIYLTPPKGKKDRAMWRTWIPDVIIEVVSPSSDDRDYTDKRDEYWTLGIKEYGIVDAKREQVLALRRGKSDWIEKTLGPDAICETKLLPGFKLQCRAIFEAAGDGQKEDGE